MRVVKLFLCLFVLSSLWSCSLIRAAQDPPKLAVTSFEVGDSDGLSQAFIIGLKLTNPNVDPIELRGLSYSLALNGYELVHGVNGNIPVIEGYSEVSVRLLAQTNLFSALRFLNNYVSAGSRGDLAYELSAKLDFGGLMGKLSVKDSGVVAVGAESGLNTD